MTELQPPDEIWPPYWTNLSDQDHCQSLKAELAREVPAGHVLFGKSVIAKAVGRHPDDVVFQLDDGRYATVHLTWSQESDPQMPYTLVFEDLASLARCREWG